MDSLLANYGSDDDEEEPQQQQPTRKPLSASIPPPRVQDLSSNGPARKSSLFASLPLPKLASEDTWKSQVSVVESHRNERKASDATAIGVSRDARDEVKRREAEDAVNRVSDKGSVGARRSFATPVSEGVNRAPGTRLPLFNRLPPPKNAGLSGVPLTSQKSSGTSLKRVVELRPAINMALLQETDDDDNVNPPVKRHVTEGMTRGNVTGLAAILPKPKNLGSALGSGYASGHQATLDVGTPATSEPLVSESTLGSRYVSDQQATLDVAVPHAVSDSSETWSSHAHHNGSHESTFGAWEGYDVGADLQDQPEAVQPNAAFPDPYLSSSAAQGAAECQSHFLAPEAYSQDMVAHETFGMSSSRDALAQLLTREKRKGGKNAPVNIVEVKQADLTASKVREDQLKTTGIAFGPAYKPVSTNKNKPSKLHRRKHQIGSLYYDMKQKEMELIERRAKGYMTKAETQAKYGW